MTQTEAKGTPDRPVKETTSPFLIEFFLVKVGQYQCMAYCDENGRWRHAFSHAFLPGEVQILQ